MAEMQNYMGVFRAQGPDDRRKVAKRNRQPVSCVPCRMKKLKCDRQQPCGACVKRGDSLSCEFGASSVVPPVRSKEKTRSEAQARLQKLEEMVNGLIQARTSSDTSAAGGSREIHDRMRNLDVSSPANKLRDSTSYYLSSHDTEASFVGPTHWIAVLEGIHDLRGFLNLDDDAPLTSPGDAEAPLTVSLGAVVVNVPPSTTSSSAASQPSSREKQDLILGPYEAITVEDVMDALPESAVIGNLLALYFTSRFFAVPFLHSEKFQRDYMAFRENPHGTSLMFISVLYSVLCVASGIVVASGKADAWPEGTINPRKYMHVAGQLIIAGEYLKAQPYVIEALLLHCHSKFLRTVDSEPSLWSLTGLTVRLAQKLGMHRDPARLSKTITPFAAEMRRRMWFHCETFDLMMSFQLGMPPIINENECDIGHPRNLLVTDFDENSTELPPERSEAESSPMLFYCYKSRVIRLFRRVLKHALSTHQPPYSETMEIDKELRKLHQAIPAKLRICPIRDAPFSDSTADIMKRLMLEMLYLKSLTVLHRTFLTYARDDPVYALSRESTISASLRMLDLQEEYTTETKPGGRIHEERWLMSSLTLHDFLMAAMIICLDLAELPQKSPEIRQQKIVSLRKSYALWDEKKEISRDARHAASIIWAMLSKVTAGDEVAGTSTSSTQPASRNTGANPAQDKALSAYITGRRMPGEPCLRAAADGSLHPANSYADAASYGQQNMLQGQAADLPAQTGAEQATGESPLTDESFELMDLDSLDEMFSDPQNLDWNLVDQYLRDNAPELPGHLAIDPFGKGA